MCDNAGFDSTHMLNKLRKAHAEGEIWAGVDVQKEGVSNNYEAFVWEPALVKINAIQAASEAAISVLSVNIFSIDSVITNNRNNIARIL